MNRLVIIGASGHGKVAADIALRTGYTDIVFLDDNENIKECAGFPVIGRVNDIRNINADIFIAIGNPEVREKIQNELEQSGISVVSLIHPNAVISRRVEIGKGSIVMAGAVINSDVRIGKGVIINTCASVDHDCVVQDYAHISVGAHLAGTVQIGKRSWIGVGAVVKNNLIICNDCMIGAGAVVVKDITVSGTYIGVPAVKRYEENVE